RTPRDFPGRPGPPGTPARRAPPAARAPRRPPTPPRRLGHRPPAWRLPPARRAAVRYATRSWRYSQAPQRLPWCQHIDPEPGRPGGQVPDVVRDDPFGAARHLRLEHHLVPGVGQTRPHPDPDRRPAADLAQVIEQVAEVIGRQPQTD